MQSGKAEKHLAFVLPDLRAGGVERITIDLMHEFLRRGYRVDLVLGRREGELVEQIPDDVRVFILGETRLRRMIAPLRRYLRSERPTAVRAAMWSLTTVAILAAFGLPARPRVVVSEHNPLTRQFGANRLKQLELTLSILATYRFADGIVAVSDAVAGEVSKLARLPRARVTTIHNPVSRPLLSPPDRNTAWGGAMGKRILAVGRLKAQKNHKLLIDAFLTFSSRQEATLAIVGEGELRPELEAHIRFHGLQERVFLPGFSATPGDWYAGADLFVLSSDYEGFGNVIVEALHFGLPVVATDCPGGPAEILENGKWGRLVPPGDAMALAAAMEAALGERQDEARQRERAEAFSLRRAADAYEALLFGKTYPAR